jgi:hypothetical protein
MFFQELVRQWEVGRGIITQVERNSSPHGKRVSIIIIKLMSKYHSTIAGLSKNNYEN